MGSQRPCLGFNDPLIDNKIPKKDQGRCAFGRYLSKLEEKINKESQREKNVLGCFDQQQFLATNPNVLGNRRKSTLCGTKWLRL
jgi:hypothetical protein